MSKAQAIIFSFILFLPSYMFSNCIQAKETQEASRLPLEELRHFTQTFERIRQEYIEEVDDKKLLEMSIKGLLGSLDPHSEYLDEQAFSLLEEHSSGEFGGLGVEVSLEKGAIRVISPIDGTPAYRAGILPGDLIIKLDSNAVQNMTFGEAIEVMRGPKGSTLLLTIVRGRADAPIEISVERDIIHVSSVRSEIPRSGFGYIRIAQFQENTGQQFKKALSDLSEKDSQLKGVVLDLRNNPGGLLTTSIEVVDAVLDGGLVVYTEGRGAKSSASYQASSGDRLNGLPMVVLINEGSASAAEIVAGALQDHGRALILGTNSFGKGSVQTIFPLGNNRGMKLTTARYFTPNKRSIQALGIKPDIIVQPADIKVWKKNSVGIKEANLPRHLSSPLGQKNPKEKEVTISDNQLHDALNLLQGLHLLGKTQPES
ncbi:MAG: S41 family peptidase [Porticoccus sp.]|jgi:carboxyl-terminal processing protease|uniref:S41 family peptidase n=1 Tax=Porticoccus sp. Uisw_050_02 TaxID=3230978 RepID=UPI00309574BC|tara:strand:+ start:1057 stop:2340 length:1284 start_codon:yes stop_codon:yes gene_type:complete